MTPSDTALARHHVEKQVRTDTNGNLDISEHLHLLRLLAAHCSDGTVLECGVRTVVSTWAFLLGLADRKENTTKLTLCDTVGPDPGQLQRLEGLSRTLNVAVDSVIGNDLQVTFPLTQYGMVFIDTWHVYPQLKAELARFADVATNVIVMHDTTVDATFGESLRCGLNVPEQAKESGFSEEDIQRGLWPAVTEFLAEHSEWQVLIRLHNCNGLTVLCRTGVDRGQLRELLLGL